jgi:hypothetical protein
MLLLASGVEWVQGVKFNEALPRRAPYEWVQGVKASACLKFFFCWIFLILFLTDLCFDLFVHFFQLIFNFAF